MNIIVHHSIFKNRNTSMAQITPDYMNGVVAVGIDNPSDPKTPFWVGTGFLFGYRNDTYEEDEYSVFLVSNKHVFEEKKKLYLKFNPQGGQPAKDYKLNLIDEHGKKLYVVHSDPNIDVAVATIDINVLDADGIVYHCFKCDKEAFTKENMKALGITEGDGVFVLGYPMGLVGTSRQYVILREGSIARVREMLEGFSSDFIVDAFVFPGNSGGPVIIKPTIERIEGTQAVPESRLIGLVKSYITYEDIANSAQTGRPRVVFEENTGLTNIEPVDYIMQLIESEFVKYKKLEQN